MKKGNGRRPDLSPNEIVGSDSPPPGAAHSSEASIAEHRSSEGSQGSKGSKSNKAQKTRPKPRKPKEPAGRFRKGSDNFRSFAPPTDAVADWLPKGFRRLRDGSIEYEAKSDMWEWLCSPISVGARTRNSDGVEWGLLIRLRDSDNRWHEWAMPAGELAGAGDAYRERLLSMGLKLAPGAKARHALHRLLTAADPGARAMCVSTLGWHGDAFLLPDETIGQQAGERFVLQTNAPLAHPFRVAGTLEGWRDEIGGPAVGNSRLILSISAAFAAPLLRPLGMEGGGLHWRGGSSTGKTTTGEVAGSIWGGGRDGYKVTWRATDNGIEAVAAIHNDGLAVLDEIGQVSAEALGATAYMLANGQAKRRMTRDGAARSTAAWSLLFVSTGEIGIADKLSENTRGIRRMMAGQQVRVLELPAEAGKGYGVFDHLAGSETGQVLADRLKKAASTHYGHPIRAYLRTLAAQRPWEQIREFVAKFVAEVSPAGADGQVRRAASRFGVIAAGGEMAQRYGIVPWPEGEATRAAKRLFNEWLIARGGSEPAEIASGMAAVRHFIELHGASRFVPWDDPSRVVHNRAGYSRQDDSGTAYFVLPEAWRRDVLLGHDAGLIARELSKRGMLKATADGKPQTKQRLPDGSERRVYVVLPALFSLDGMT